MHLEILVEDQSGKRMLEILVPKIIDTAKHTFVVRPYKGIGKIPKNMRTAQDAAMRQLLDQLSRLWKDVCKLSECVSGGVDCCLRP